MSPEITSRIDALRELCRRYHVVRLDVFGSVATGRDRPESDIDFLVEFEPLTPAVAVDSYFGLKEALRDLFGRRIDLVMTTAIKNRYFQESVDDTRQLLYTAAA